MPTFWPPQVSTSCKKLGANIWTHQSSIQRTNRWYDGPSGTNWPTEEWQELRDKVIKEKGGLPWLTDLVVVVGGRWTTGWWWIWWKSRTKKRNPNGVFFGGVGLGWHGGIFVENSFCQKYGGICWRGGFVRSFNIDFVNFILDSLEEALKWWSCCSKSDVDDVKSGITPLLPPYNV